MKLDLCFGINLLLTPFPFYINKEIITNIDINIVNGLIAFVFGKSLLNNDSFHLEMEFKNKSHRIYKEIFIHHPAVPISFSEIKEINDIHLLLLEFQDFWNRQISKNDIILFLTQNFDYCNDYNIKIIYIIESILDKYHELSLNNILDIISDSNLYLFTNNTSSISKYKKQLERLLI